MKILRVGYYVDIFKLTKIKFKPIYSTSQIPSHFLKSVIKHNRNWTYFPLVSRIKA